MLSKDTIIIIAVFSAVGAFILFLLLLNALKHLTSTSSPLPPVQPLAHHRELHIAKLEAALPTSQTWYPNSTLSAHNSFGTPSPRGGSSTSLIAKHPPPSPDETILTEMSSGFSPASPHTLALPSPFNPARPGSSSSLTSSSLTTSSNEAAQVNTPSSVSSSYISLTPRERSSFTNLRGSHYPVPSRRQRPLSVASSHSTIYSKASRNTMRGLPHSRHSQIQIVLPAPLATGTDMADASRRMNGDNFDRKSVVDRWVSASDSSAEIPVVMNRHSQPEMSRTFMTSPSAPPVPRVPSMFIDLDGEMIE